LVEEDIIKVSFSVDVSSTYNTQFPLCIKRVFPVKWYQSLGYEMEAKIFKMY